MRGCARLLAAVLPLAAACFSLTSPTQASARQVTGGERYSGSSALLFSAGWSRSEQSGVWMINADGSGLRRLAPIGSDASWSPDGRLIAYVSADHWMIERTDGSGRYRVPLPVGQTASWTAHGHDLLAYRAAAGPGHHSVIYSIDAGVRHATRRELERTLDSVEGSVVASPTGSGYAYGTEVGDVWFTQISGKPALVSEQPEGTSVLAFSPDGTGIAVARPGPSQTEQIAIVAIDGGHARALNMPKMDTVFAAAWSPDGQALAITGSDQIVLVPTAGGASFSMHFDGSGSATWSPDGRWLAYIDHGGLWLLNAQTHVKHRLTAANFDSRIVWQPSSNSTAALETVPSGRIPPGASSTGRTLETSGIVREISLHNSTVVVDVAASRLHCERLLRWQPRGTVAELHVRARWGGAGCATAFGVLGLAASRAGALLVTASGGLEINEEVAIAKPGARARIVGRFASTIGGFGTSVTGGQDAGGLLAFATDYVCAGPEITNGGPYRCPRAVPEGTVTRSSLFVERMDRTVLIRRVPYQMELYDAVPGRLLLGEVPQPAPGAARAAVALIVNTRGRVLHSVALPVGTGRLLFSGGDIVAITGAGLTLLTQTGTALATDPVPAGGRVVGATAGLAAIVTPSSLRIMRLRDGRSITLLRSAQIHAAVSAKGIAYSYAISRGSSRGRVVFVPLRTLLARLH